MPIELILKTG